MATAGVIDYDPTSQSDPQERQSSWPSGSMVSTEPLSRHDGPRSRREMLHILADQFHAEKRRADHAERMFQELTLHLTAINDARLQALHDAAKANEELKLYKIQLRSAQDEIYRAQEVIEVVDRQRYNAEKEAAKFRSMARQLNENILMLETREEAWKLGLQEGLNRGREQSNEENRFVDYPEEPGTTEDTLDDDDDDFIGGTTSSPDLQTLPARPPSSVPLIQNRLPSRLHPSPSPIPTPLPSNLPTVARSVHSSENVRPITISIRSGYTRPPSRQPATPSPTPVFLPDNPPLSSQSIHSSQNVRPMSIRSGYTRPSSRQRVSPSPVFVPSNTRPYENIPPASIHPTTPRHTPGVIPPDNFIPSLDADNKIRIPPPHEFHRAVMTPERPLSPQLPAMSDSSQEALMVPGPQAKTPGSQQHRKRYHRRHSSSDSNSSSLSTLDIINDRHPTGVRTPMSIIPEVLSVQSTASQLPDGDNHARRQYSFSASSIHTLNLDNPQHMEAQAYLGPHSRSSYAGSTRDARSKVESHSGNSYGSSPIGISVQPPSRPTSIGQWGSSSKANASP